VDAAAEFRGVVNLVNLLVDSFFSRELIGFAAVPNDLAAVWFAPDCQRPAYKKAVNDDPLSFTATLVRCSRERGCSRVGTATGFLRDADCSAN
jgi:hypothetical protein